MRDSASQTGPSPGIPQVLASLTEGLERLRELLTPAESGSTPDGELAVLNRRVDAVLATVETLGGRNAGLDDRLDSLHEEQRNLAASLSILQQGLAELTRTGIAGSDAISRLNMLQARLERLLDQPELSDVQPYGLSTDQPLLTSESIQELLRRVRETERRQEVFERMLDLIVERSKYVPLEGFENSAH